MQYNICAGIFLSFVSFLKTRCNFVYLHSEIHQYQESIK